MILVTGASGFLGTHLLQALVNQSMLVKAVYNSSKPAFQHPNIQWVQCDLLDVIAVGDLMKEVTHVYHCAAAVSFEAADAEIVTRRNVDITANVVDAALEANVTKLIHVSSIAALGRPKVEGGKITEEDSWEESPRNTAYAKGKYQAEMEVWRAMAEGLCATILNPGIILGEGDWDKGSAKLMQTVYNEFAWYTEGVNGFVDVKDVVKAMILLMDSAIDTERYILVEGNHAYKDLFREMAIALNRKAPYKKASKLATELIWRLEAVKSTLTGKKSAITKETANTAQNKTYYDNSKSLSIPDFEYTPMLQTIQRMAKQYMKDLQNG